MTQPRHTEFEHPWFDELDLLECAARTLPNGLLVDVGAHIGRFSRRFADLGWRVVAFEAAPEIARQLERTLAPYENSRAVPCAVSDVDGESIEFYLSEDHWGIHSLAPFDASHTSKIEIPTRRLDSSLTDDDYQEPTFLKIDIEGADFLALKGWDFDSCRPRIVMCEFMDSRSEPFFGYTYSDMIEYMAEREYAAYVSEWSPVAEYARHGVATTGAVHLGVFPHPLHHKPAWGNLLFVPDGDCSWFESEMVQYLTVLQEESWTRLFNADREHAENVRMATTIQNRELRLDALVESTHRLRARISELESAVVQRDVGISELESAIVQRDARISELESAVVQRDARISELRDTKALTETDRDARG